MTVKEIFEKSIQTIKQYPRLLVFALALVVFFNLMQGPALMHRDSFYPSYSEMNLDFFVNEMMVLVFPSLPGGTPTGEMFSMEQGLNQADILPWLIVLAIFSFLALVFFSPAYLGIVRDSIQKRQPEVGTFFTYGKQFFSKFLALIVLLVLIIIAISVFFGIFSFMLISITGIGRDTVLALFNVVTFIVFFFLIFAQFEILEGGPRGKVTEAMKKSIKLVASKKLKVLSYLAALLGVGILTLAAGIILDMLPFIISAFLVPLLYGLVTTFSLVALYHAYFNISGKMVEE